MKELSVIIPAAGGGKRMGGNVGKQFLLLDGIPIFIHTLSVFQRCAPVCRIAVVAPAESIGQIREEVGKRNLSKVAAVVQGGRERQDSVICGLRAMGGSDSDIIMIHDAVRPFVLESDIEAVADAAQIHGAAVIATQPTDTMKLSDDGKFCESTLKRSLLWSVQTPQAFRRGIFEEACRKAEKDEFYGTDDAELVERLGIRIKIVPGHADNIKVTIPEDFEHAERILARRKRETAGG